ncbi:MAG: diguanylate cyclase [Pseudomonadota bacterium]
MTKIIMDKHNAYRPQLLIVDDTPANIEILLDALERDYEVTFSTSGLEALQLIAESETPDLILLDVMMPEMDGYEVCRRLKQNPITCEIPIIFVTALNSSESESTGLALGADDYITKPINLEIARLRIKNVLERTRLGRKLELTLACSDQGLWEYDLSSNCVSIDPRWAMPLGYASGEFGDQAISWDKLLHPDDLAILHTGLDAYLKGSTAEISIEVRMRGKNGVFYWMHVLSKGTNRNAANRPTRLLGTYMNISRRKHDENAVEESKNRLETLINSIPDTVLTFDTHGVLTQLHVPVSQANFFGSEAYLQCHYSTIFPNELSIVLDALMDAAIQLPTPQSAECHLIVEDKRLDFSVSVTRLISTEEEWESGFLAVIRDITLAKLAEEELRKQAFHDPLTSLPNRRLLNDRLHQAQLYSSRYHGFAALMLLDLNKFKQINDTYGHEIGDKLLIEVANRLQMTLRVNDTIVRLGGDEFVVLIEGLDANEETALQQATLVFDKLIDSLGQEYQFGDLGFYCSASIGVKIFKGEEDRAEEILKDADLAMYKMKDIKIVEPE